MASLRKLIREPAKRMLIFFSVDQTTTVLDTAKVKEIIEGDKIEEGAKVLVKFGKDNFEARIIKLHDDPGVLLEAETEFLIQMFGGGNDAHDADKENQTPTAEPNARRPPLANKTNSPHPQATKKRKKNRRSIEGQKSEEVNQHRSRVIA
ncbi:uncharacterized protein LOC114533231 [Dendronephthya gigantea]|uniref:uncharacterized protein LOC114533231 n=1 Tax=Dendronephthya gigantea TaxID=151771 RepID=UPI00106D20FC|nr:uncharacterized protein LOC114533231 [Dendronephthya gigantea]